jgi:hypothetical protein
MTRRNTSGISCAQSYRTLRDGSLGALSQALRARYDRRCPSGTVGAPVRTNPLGLQRADLCKAERRKCRSIWYEQRHPGLAGPDRDPFNIRSLCINGIICGLADEQIRGC